MSRHKTIPIGARRVVAVPVAVEMLVQMVREDYLTPGPMKCIKGVPADAKFEGATIDPGDGAALLLFSHPSFKPLFPGEPIPRVISAHRRTDVQVEYT